MFVLNQNEKTMEKHQDLLNFITEKHKDHKRKYTGDPYIKHLLNVGKMAESYNIHFGFEIGLCHDVLEDTDCTFKELYVFLNSLYGKDFDSIYTPVLQLTDKYTHERFPEFNRAKRKSLEATRLGGFPDVAQSVKYCDLIDNSQDISRNDKKFAEIYLKEKFELLTKMRGGDTLLRRMCINVLLTAMGDIL